MSSRGAIGSAFGPGRIDGIISPTLQQKQAMERPSAWARDEDLEEGKRLHELKAKAGWAATIGLGYKAIGIIFGDVGTSPLYVFASIFQDPPDHHDLMGATSMIFWTLTLVALIKYVFIVLRVDDHGEGGTFALYARLARCCKLPTPTATEQEFDTNLTRYGTKLEKGAKASIGNYVQRAMQRSLFLQRLLLIVVLGATCMLIGDGTLTPAISVVSSITGLQENSSIGQPGVIGVSCAILILLFVFQRLGTSKLGHLFAPVILLWFFANFCIGIYNIIVWHPAIFSALSPHYMFIFWRDARKDGWEVMAGVLLCITGVEAMYADLGHFSRRAVQLSFSCVVYPSVVITYLGQAAYLYQNPDDYDNTFYASIPNPVYWPMFVIATLAAIVASQAIISGTFSIIRQSLMLGCFPRVKVVHTSGLVEGQIYIPEANWIMMVLTIIVVAGFRDAVSITYAYGVAVTFVMFMTTLIITLAILVVWNHNILVAIAFFVVFGLIDGAFLTAALSKFTHGGWFPVALAAILFTISVLWYWGTKRKVNALDNQKVLLADLFRIQHPADDEDSEERDTVNGALQPVMLKNGEKIQRVPGTAFVYCNTYTGIPASFANLLKNYPGLHEQVVFITIRYVPVPKVSKDERLLFMSLPVPGLFRCVARYGYTDQVDMEGEFTKGVLTCLAKHAKPEVASRLAHGSQDVIDPDLKLVYILGRTETVPQKGLNVLVRMLLDHMYNFLRRNSRTIAGTFNVPKNRLLEVGVVVEI